MNPLGCLIIIIVFLLFGFIGSFFGNSDEYDKFITNTQSSNETPWEYLPNKDVGHCVNVGIPKTLTTEEMETYCAQNLSVIEAFSKCFHHETGLMGGHAKELINLTQFMKASYLNRISDYEAAGRARIFFCTLRSGNKVYQMKKNYIEKDVQKIKSEKEEAGELKVSYKCLIAYKNHNQTTECNEKELKKVKAKYQNSNKKTKSKIQENDFSQVYEFKDTKQKADVKKQKNKMGNQNQATENTNNIASSTFTSQKSQNTDQIHKQSKPKVEKKPAIQETQPEINQDVDDFMN